MAKTIRAKTTDRLRLTPPQFDAPARVQQPNNERRAARQKLANEIRRRALEICADFEAWDKASGIAIMPTTTHALPKTHVQTAQHPPAPNVFWALWQMAFNLFWQFWSFGFWQPSRLSLHAHAREPQTPTDDERRYKDAQHETLRLDIQQCEIVPSAANVELNAHRLILRRFDYFAAYAQREHLDATPAIHAKQRFERYLSTTDKIKKIK